MLRFLCCAFLVQVSWAQVVYDAYFGKPISDKRSQLLASLNATGVCTVTVSPCRHDEGRRVDGTCVNPRYPPRGASPTPLLRMLPPKFGIGNTERPAMNGSRLPSTRLIRTKILAEGLPEDPHFTVLATHLMLFHVVDSVDLTELPQYVVVSDCCLGNTPNRVNPKCIAIEVPPDDFHLRQTGIQCLNVSRFSTYQDRGCIPNTLPAERYALPTPLEDLSVVYGYNSRQGGRVRLRRDGLLTSEVRNGIEYPPGREPLCIGNLPPENVCYEFGDAFDGNALVGITLPGLWFFREHNRLARALGRVNPCWDDEKLFQTARQINIAEWQYILYYEVLAELLGRKLALEAGIIYDTDGFVDDFDESYKPGAFHEYSVGARYFHIFQDGRTDLYSNKGKYLGTRTTVDDEFRSGIFELNNTEADLTQGAFRQRAAKFDHTMDYDLAERAFGQKQAAADLPAIDMVRSRDLGLQPYTEYRRLCGLPRATHFRDLEDVIDPDKVEQLRRIFDNVADIDLMVGIYSERPLPGSNVGPTLFCIMATTLLQWRKSDRHFFEHGHLPSSFSLSQLNEIRKTSAARLLCDVGVGVDNIQPRAIFNIGKGNEIVSCKEIPSVDLDKWYDYQCPLKKETEKKVADKEDKKEGDDKKGKDDNYDSNVNVWKPHEDYLTGFFAKSKWERDEMGEKRINLQDYVFGG